MRLSRLCLWIVLVCGAWNGVDFPLSRSFSGELNVRIFRSVQTSTWLHKPEDSNLQRGVCYKYKVDGDMAANRTVTVFKFWNTDAANCRSFRPLNSDGKRHLNNRTPCTSSAVTTGGAAGVIQPLRNLALPFLLRYRTFCGKKGTAPNWSVFCYCVRWRFI